MELHYNPRDVFKGNTFSLSFSSTTNRDKVYQSNNPKSKYRVENFIIKVDQSIQLKKTDVSLEIYIPEEFGWDHLSISLTDYYNNNSKFNFDIPLFNYVAETKAIKVSPPSRGFVEYTIGEIDLEAILQNNTVLSVSRSNQFIWSDFDIRLVRGGEFEPKPNYVLINSSHCNDSVVFHVNLKENASIVLRQAFPIQKNSRIQADFSGKKGQARLKAKTGVSGIDGALFKGLDGTNGSSGQNGMNGLDGARGNDLQIYYRLVKEECASDTVLEIEIKNADGAFLAKYHMNRSQQIIQIMANGGNGGTGGEGGNGGRGGNAHLYLYPEDKTAGNGGDGGDAGNGGIGGNGGDGGSIIVYYTEATEKYLNQLVLMSEGGKGGFGGSPGQVGRGGRAGNGTQSKGNVGRDGRQGYAGGQGYDGREGSVAFILISE